MKETVLKIKVFGDTVLRKKARSVNTVTSAHRDILARMSGLMYDSSGIGLAAPQVGISECMIVADIGSGLYKLINPRIVKKEGSQSMEEGCLSVPGVCIKIRRAKAVVVEALDENGKPVVIEAKDLLACVLQHEIDHLKGKLIVDYATFIERLKIKRKLNQLRKKSENGRVHEQETKSCELSRPM